MRSVFIVEVQLKGEKEYITKGVFIVIITRHSLFQTSFAEREREGRVVS